MQPAAAEVERETRSIDNRPSPPAQPRPRFDQQAVDTRIAQPPSGSDAGRAAADNRDLGFTPCHKRISSNGVGKAGANEGGEMLQPFDGKKVGATRG